MQGADSTRLRFDTDELEDTRRKAEDTDHLEVVRRDPEILEERRHALGSGALQHLLHLQCIAEELRQLEARASGLEHFLYQELQLADTRAYVCVSREQLPVPLAATLAISLLPILQKAGWQCSPPVSVSPAGVCLPPEYQQFPVAYQKVTHGLVHANVVTTRRSCEGTPKQAVFRLNAPIDADTPAKLRCLRIYLPDVPGAVEQANVWLDQVLAIAQQHMPYRGHLLEFCASTLRLVDFLEEPVVTDDDFIVTDTLRAQLLRHLVYPVRYREKLESLGISPWRGAILEGPPGVGKTLASRWLWGKLKPLGVTMLVTSVAGLENRLGIASGIMQLFETARTLQPAVVWLEDVDFIAKDRGSWASGPLGALLHALDGVISRGQVLVVATTNAPEVLDAAIARRPGRFDARIDFPLPDADCRRQMLHRFTAALVREGRLEGLPESVVGESEGLSGAHLRELVAEAVLLALEEANAPESAQVRTHHLEWALARLKERRRRMGFFSSDNLSADTSGDPLLEKRPPQLR